MVSERYIQSLSDFSLAILHDEPGFEHYSNNYFVGHCEALTTVFPCVQVLLGEAVFSALAQVYVQHFPAEDWDLNVYGEGFPSFLEAQIHSSKSNEYDWALLGRIAALEYGISLVYYAKGVGEGSFGQYELRELKCKQQNIEGVNQDIDPSVDFSLLIHQCHPYVDICKPFCLWESMVIMQVHDRLKIDNRVSADHRESYV